MIFLWLEYHPVTSDRLNLNSDEQGNIIFDFKYQGKLTTGMHISWHLQAETSDSF